MHARIDRVMNRTVCVNVAVPAGPAPELRDLTVDPSRTDVHAGPPAPAPCGYILGAQGSHGAAVEPRTPLHTGREPLHTGRSA